MALNSSRSAGAWIVLIVRQYVAVERSFMLISFWYFNTQGMKLQIWHTYSGFLPDFIVA
jgi:hypothetical protein